jgi:TatD DNase family protein
MIIDTHCHLSINDYDDVSKVIENMENNIMIVSGSDIELNKEVLQLCNKYKNIYGTIGIHPNSINEYTDDAVKFIEENITNPKIVGIGEIGLDYYWAQDKKEEQKKIFINQIKLAKKYKKPFVIHSRDAMEDIISILEQETDHNIKAVMHCYTGNLEDANKLISMGIKLGIGGIVTFKNAKELQEVVRAVDLSNIVLETDSPYLAPEPFRGTKNEPKNTAIIAMKIAIIKGKTADEIITATTTNAMSIFDLKGVL